MLPNRQASSQISNALMMKMRTTKNLLHVLFALLAMLFASMAVAAPDEPAGAINETLRIRINGKAVLGEADLQNRKFADANAAMAEFRKNIVTLQRHASVQLMVEAVDVRGRASNVTTHPATTYQSLSPARLSVSSDGQVTASPGPDAPAVLSGDLAVLIVFDHQAQQGWNKIFFNIVP